MAGYSTGSRKILCDASHWQTVDGAVKLTPREGERGWSRWSAYLWSKKEYQDFWLTRWT